MRQLVLELAPLPAPTFRNFVPGRNAELLHSLQCAAAGDTGSGSLYLWGAPGSGRSHLLQATVAAVLARGGSAAAVAGVDAAPLDPDLWRLDCVAVDDVERCAAECQILLFNLYNAVRERRALMVVSGDVPPPQLAVREDLATRLGWGLVYQVHALSDEDKAQALQQHAAARGMQLPDEVCGYLLARVRRDMPTLLALLDAIDRQSLETKRAVTIPFVRELLQSEGGGELNLGIRN